MRWRGLGGHALWDWAGVASSSWADVISPGRGEERRGWKLSGTVLQSIAEAHVSSQRAARGQPEGSQTLGQEGDVRWPTRILSEGR